MITPKVLKGFRDYLPNLMINKKELISQLEVVFENFGFSPIDTPALEYTEILLGKGSGETDKQIYRFKDHGKRDVSLRFDLTVPLARYVSTHLNELVFPFKAYHIAPVWRGENTQKGRYREFFQCDFDILGSTSYESDLEILLLIGTGLEKLNAGTFRININNRKILNAFLSKLGLIEKSVDILRTIDKIYKIGLDMVIEELVNNIKIDEKTSLKLIELLGLNDKTNKYYEITGDDIFEVINRYKIELNDEYPDVIGEIEYIFKTLKSMDILDYYAFNPAITRGLDYYDGIIFESFILDSRNFGSICSGGRYNNLTSLYSKTVIPGVGASFGLDRILALMEDKKNLNKKESNTELIIFNLDPKFFANYQVLAQKLRAKGINTEVYLENKKIQTQFKYAEKKSIRFALFAGEDEIAVNKFNLKDIIAGEEMKNIDIYTIAELLNKLLQ